ncbi:MAG: helix-turn-helix domain-containing protein, partial [Alphaproteobacteria bacterium]|nr:helix-turn-helix domain-containing protein [Alphaproteobacteria bacterium]
MTDNENWPLLISRYRKLHALTQAAFAERFHVSQQTISRWENGQQSPHLLAQQALRSAIAAASNATTECWRQRIE